MTLPRIVITDEDNQPPSISTSNVATSAPNVTVEGICMLDGDWILRRYSNDHDFERLLLERRTSQVLQVAGGAPPKPASTAQIVGPRANIVRNQPNTQTRATQQGQEQLSRAKSSTNKLAGTSASQATTHSTRRKVVFHAAFDEKGQLTRKTSVPKQRMIFDPVTDMPSLKSTRNKVVPTPQPSHSSGLIVQEGGMIRAEKGKKGTWHFLTKAAIKTDDVAYGRSDEGKASLKMGNKGHWEPDTLPPSAEDINNFRECMRCHKLKDEVSAGIDIVWVETQGSRRPEQEEDEQQEDNGEVFDALDAANLEPQKERNVTAALAATSYATDKPATAKATNAESRARTTDKPATAKPRNTDSRASESGTKPPRNGPMNPGGLDYYRRRVMMERARAELENEAAVKHDDRSVHAQQETVEASEPATQPKPHHPQEAPVRTQRPSTRPRGDGHNDSANSPPGTKRKASADDNRLETLRSGPGSSHFHTLKGAYEANADEGTGNQTKRQRLSEIEEHGSSPLSDPPESEHGDVAKEARSDVEQREAEGETSRNPMVIESGDEDSDETDEVDEEDDVDAHAMVDEE